MKKVLFTLACLVLIGQVSAQSYTIYPIPQQMEQGSEIVNLSRSIDVVCESGIDEFTRNRLTNILKEHWLNVNITDEPGTGRSVVYLGINGSGEKADWMATICC